MAQYTDLTCTVCGQKFSENDDIVVCHICGTPHHRECYKKLGHCVNQEWHNENKVYNVEEEKEKIEAEKREEERAEQKKEEAEAPDKICKRCGNANSSQAIFCDRCGAPLEFSAPQNEGQGGFYYAPAGFPPFALHNPEEEIEGVKVWKLAAAVRENSFRFISQFKALTQKKSKTSFNFAAFLFSPFYFFYRKMYGTGIITLILTIIFDLPNTILSLSNENLSKVIGATVDFGLDFTIAQVNFLTMAAYFAMFLSTALQILCGLYANWLYFRKCKKLCLSYGNGEKSKEELIPILNKKGGVNRAIIIVFIAVYMFIVWSAMFFAASPNFFG